MYDKNKEDINRNLVDEIIKNKKLEQIISYIHELLCSEFNNFARANAEGKPPLLTNEEMKKINSEYKYIIKKIKEKAILEQKKSKGDIY